MGRDGAAKYLLFLTRVGGWSEKGQKHPYVISERSLKTRINAGIMKFNIAMILAKP